MKLCRFQLATQPDAPPRIGLVEPPSTLRDLTAAGVTSLTSLLTGGSALQRVADLRPATLPRMDLADARLLAPVERQEVWAAGVTYLRSKQARMDESQFSASAYDRVYDAERPELFFKSMPEKTVGPGDPIGVRHDSHWTVPEPELALVLDPSGQILGYTIGNDVSARDIEGENLLYLPQAKTYRGSCALGPWIAVGVPETQARTWTITLDIRRANRLLFSGTTELARLKRPAHELAAWLFRSQTFPHGAVLLTGTGIVPPDDVRLQPGDQVAIAISGIGILANPVQNC
ncbi:MAG: fumarylacetoacetate hydrolase [Verrucomicrobia bacterium]|nr:fumarylacetoacetate hydrolase [Verrucomicrobiota bacterium]